ncbi:L-glutamate gamma-semialdehyde dehydrogenase [Variovorax ginsengisoli]|uniref:Bifunctional protein PutA n=1 Tax=Variovorax ginsengisoli TaxID=363844 RepID=A0ABT9SA85_9BURK|nr:L-glutamate gamma-semialdehyde dehydrogenase [Variovorax ginsengisoli]MDP9901269.1 RHH-type proline utilization regulon transcriptional repressor/proline dehydrogenase/delta 1-pyrroline-5-carboxylate dehydrogenase [Variovorax ginsengisoli]
MRLPHPYRPEKEIVSQRLASLTGALDWAAAATVAVPWVQAVRNNPPPFWAMESLLREYPISSAEGLALMRLAEALLRVPDAETAIALTADQLGRADFDGAADSTLARLSSSAIALSKRFLPESDHPPGLLARLGSRTVVAATLRAVQLLGRQFVLGQTIREAMGEARSAQKKQPALCFSYDMLGEGARTDADAQRYLQSYADAIRSIGAIGAQSDAARAPEHNDGISIKLSALHPRYEDAQHQRVMAELVPRVWQLCALAADANLNLTIDAEEVDRLELSLEVFEALAARIAAEKPQWRGFGLAMQAYQTRALELIDEVTTIARRHGLRLMCRLVKGAYWDAEIKRAQELGLPHYPVFTHKHHSDVSYLACARAMLAAPDAIYPQFATHNAGTIAAILQMAGVTGPHAPPLRGSLPPEGAQPGLGRPGAGFMQSFELQRLHGMGEGVYREVMKATTAHVRVYAPVGQHKDLLAYLVRRLLENGANSSFVNQLGDDGVPVDQLLASPLHASPVSSLPLPPLLYGPARRNSEGVDLTVTTMRAPLLAALATTSVPVVPLFDASRAEPAVAQALRALPAWRGTPVAQRAARLRHAADALQAELPRFCALLVKEAFKTWGDAVAEVREAVDFLRYYADEAERIMQPVALPGPTGESNELRLVARGPWVCISPWNFPLAIFMGQVAAALATGNTVLAKPAEQTPGVALEAVKLLHAVGVPADALQLLHGPGETVGAALVAAPGVAGVVFTGSTQVAKIIHRALAAKDGPIVPLIAETGGINAMVVDSSALPEQVVDAVVQSAFRSAGQRCSALRLLCVHEGIADGVIEMLGGAVAELAGGDPALLATDVGPLIDAEAFDTVARAVDALAAHGRPIDASPVAVPATTHSANFIAPQAFEVPSIEHVRNEIFGPVLQIVRWSGDPATVVERINALGYGLTFGIQTRIDSRAMAMAAQAHIGNVYVNRNTIGAVVGVQPFGGEGLSGTGPKAGGPHYLYRFCAEQTLTINTAAAGGNAALLAAMH